MKETFVKLLQTAWELNKKEEDIKDQFGCRKIDYLGEEIDDIVDAALDAIDIPKDTSLKYKRNHPDYYSRDYEYNLVYGYIFDADDLTANDVYEILVKNNSFRGNNSFTMKIDLSDEDDETLTFVGEVIDFD